jgi:hypothetical protein
MFGGKAPLRLAAQKSRLHAQSVPMRSALALLAQHKRTEGRAPVWGFEFTSKRRRNTGGIQHKPLYAERKIAASDCAVTGSVFLPRA